MADGVLFLPERFCRSCDVYWAFAAGNSCWACGSRGRPTTWTPRTEEELADEALRRLLGSGERTTR